MVVNGQLVESSQADALAQRLEDPRIAAALNDLLDHTELLAMLVTGLDGLVRRGDVISESLTDALGELREAGRDATAGAPGDGVDLARLAGSLRTLSGGVVDATPALAALLDSELTNPTVIDIVGQLAGALVEGRAAMADTQSPPTGIFGLMRVLKDPDVSRGLVFLIEVAKSFGRRMA